MNMGYLNFLPKNNNTTRVTILSPQLIPQLCHQNIQYFVNGKDFVLAVTKAQDLRPFSTIHHHSRLVINTNRIYAFGNNGRGQLAPAIITCLNNLNITQISCGSYNTLALTGDGRVYSWGDNSYKAIGCKGGGDIGCDGNNENVNNDNLSDTETVSCSDGNYKTQFIEMSAIGSGGFGTVFKVKHRLDDKIYAVKRVLFGDFSKEKKQKILKEVKLLSELDSKFVVKYYNSWSEGKHMFIHMEYCSQTLGSVIRDKPIVFGRQSSDAMNIYEYFISCEILRELLQCLQYLHGLDPPIIHRDLKPENVLIVSNTSNDTFVKLGDFGIAVKHNMVSMSHTVSVGSAQYMAPEVFQSRYTSKVDIYSLALVSQHLFDLFNIDNPLEIYNLTAFSANFNKLYEMIGHMFQSMADNRPTSNQVLQEYNYWSVDRHFKIFRNLT
ncbi:unnamed protein product [Medioppia subpectinata]|uniref:Protein kinase domain-containing protein n=1 Tax=Medioppia subpectinata TaxID=1979941 RepID=A0A7R9Q3B1_9ACAR|nr:unnamed protein product [Medioppia subpectinata]CAG2110269.1 unnamed protein product [Medioppia subpectinata]